MSYFRHARLAVLMPCIVQVYFVADVADLLPNEEEWPRVYAEQTAWKAANTAAIKAKEDADKAKEAKTTVRGSATLWCFAACGAVLCSEFSGRGNICLVGVAVVISGDTLGAIIHVWCVVPCR